MAKVIKHNITYNSAPSTATLLPYDNRDSGLSATTTKGAIDELADEKADKTEVPDNLQDLDNVSISSATSGQVLKYNGSNWVNADESTGSSSFADLTDVDLSNLQNGQVAKYNSTTQKWENANESGGGSTVSVTQIQSTGTKIATISVDSVDTDLYAPNGGSGGHTIVDDAGTDLTQRTNLQFKGAYTEDNSTDDTTEVNVVREMTKAEFDLLSDDEKVGFINITDVTDGAEDKFQPIIYSEEEREIGVYTDGKPLYQKTFILPSSVTIPKETWTTVANISSLNVDNLVSCIGQPANSQSASVNAYNNAGNLQVFLTFAWSIGVITIQYTKTTDTAGSGTWTPQGVPAHHYSTDEQIVGTWIDGSTLYEKTFDLGGDTEIPYNSWYNTGLTGFNKICDCFGVNNAGANYPLNASIQSDILYLWGCRGTEVSVVRYLTIRYTKSSS